MAAGVDNPMRGAVVMAGGAEYVVVGRAVDIPGVAMYVGWLSVVTDMAVEEPR